MLGLISTKCSVNGRESEQTLFWLDLFIGIWSAVSYPRYCETCVRQCNRFVPNSHYATNCDTPNQSIFTISGLAINRLSSGVTKHCLLSCLNIGSVCEIAAGLERLSARFSLFLWKVSLISAPLIRGPIDSSLSSLAFASIK